MENAFFKVLEAAFAVQLLGAVVAAIGSAIRSYKARKARKGE